MTDRRTTYRGLIVGLGQMGSLHLRVLSQIENATVVAAVDVDPQRRARAEGQYPYLRTYATVEEALTTVEVDFACVATPAATLAEIALQALDAGIAVMIEKPLAADEDA